MNSLSRPKMPASWILICLLSTSSLTVLTGQQEKRPETVVKIDDLQAQAPADWIEETPSNRFRVKQFRLPAIGDDKDNAEVVVFYFGMAGGGSREANLKRWKEMFVPPEGKKIDDVTRVTKVKVHSGEAVYVEIYGTYVPPRARPSDPTSELTRRPNYRMIKAIFETKKGPYYFSLVGPNDTVLNYKKGFDECLKAFK